jgi:hypothetical protein
VKLPEAAFGNASKANIAGAGAWAALALGELLEGLHVAGSTFERACRRLEKLLKGDGWKLNGFFQDVNQFLDSLRFDNLKSSAEQRKWFVSRIKELQPAATNTAIARTLGVSDQTVRRDVSTNVEPKKGKKEKNGGGGGGVLTNVGPGRFLVRKLRPSLSARKNPKRGALSSKRKILFRKVSLMRRTVAS